MDNFVRPGDNVDFTNSSGSDLSAGDVHQEQDMVGVVNQDTADTATGVLSLAGVYKNLPKNNTEAMANLEKVYWDSTAGEVTTTVASNALMGVAIGTFSAGATLVTVRLNGSAS